jgi:uncharacterized membrane protein HdeD (DUF308 family)
MALLDIKWNPSRRELKQFAALWVGFFGLIGLIVALVSTKERPLVGAWWFSACWQGG